MISGKMNGAFDEKTICCSCTTKVKNARQVAGASAPGLSASFFLFDRCNLFPIDFV